MIHQKRIELQNTTIQYLSSADVFDTHLPILIMLHGFPENSWTWESYIKSLSDEFCIVAPDLPGYNGSEGFGSAEQYNIPQLANTMAAFIAKLNRNKPLGLIAHDWGGVIAWALAAFHESLFHSMTIMNAAHPTAFTREMLNNPKQQENSDYITDLISDKGYELVSKDDFGLLKRLYGRHFDKITSQQKEVFLRQWENEHSMLQTFAYYQNMPNLVTSRLSKQATHEASEQKLPNIRINIPTQVLWGLRDTAFVPEVLVGMEDWIQNLAVHTFDDADHWLHHQKRELVGQYIRGFHKDKA